MKLFNTFKEIGKKKKLGIQLLKEIRQGIANQSDLTNRKMNAYNELSLQIFELQQAQQRLLLQITEQTSQFKDDKQPAAERVDQTIHKEVIPNHLSYFWGDRLLTLDKSTGFLEDPSFRAAYDAIRGSHQYDQYASPHTISWRLHTLVWAAQCGLKLDGDFVECGVFKGDMSWVISQTVKFAEAGKKFYLYDTFEGFSDKYSSANDDFPDNPNFFSFANQYYNDPNLYPYVCSRFAGRNEIKIIKGIVPDVLLEEAPEKIAFLHIDLNSPAAEIGALEVLFPRLSPGAILVFDDYGWKLFHRQKEAEDKFMRDRGYEILELPTGQGLVIKR